MLSDRAIGRPSQFDIQRIFVFNTQSKIAKRHVLVQQSYRVSKKINIFSVIGMNKHLILLALLSYSSTTLIAFERTLFVLKTNTFLWLIVSRLKRRARSYTFNIIFLYCAENKNRRIHVKRRNALDLHLSFRNAPTKVPLSTSTKSEKTATVSKPRQFAKSS